MESATELRREPRPPTVLEEVSTERVLIADDNPANLLLLRRILSRENCDVLEASDGHEALDTALRHRPDLVLLDVMMPGLDGYEVSTALKEDPDLSEVPVLFLSALSDLRSKLRGLEAGAVDYITKPFHKDEVLARVRNQLKLRRLTRELRRANDELSRKQRRIDEDLAASAAIQRSLLPAAPPSSSRVTAAWRFLPCEQNAGDLFAFHRLTDRHLAVHVIDVSGHGVPAAMMTVALSQSLAPQNGHTLQPTEDGAPPIAVSPAEVLRRLDLEYPIDRFERHFTIAYLLLDLETGEVRYSRAGHPMPFVVRRDGSIEELSAGGTIIGLGGLLPFEEGTTRLEPGDRLFAYTDGIPEAADTAGTPFGEARLYEAARRERRRTLDETCGDLIESVKSFAGTDRFDDDVTLVAIEYRGAPTGRSTESKGDRE